MILHLYYIDVYHMFFLLPIALNFDLIFYLVGPHQCFTLPVLHMLFIYIPSQPNKF